MTRLIVVVGLVLATVLGALTAPLYTASQAQLGTTFVETFDGNPGQPTAFSSPNWDVAIHGRDGLRPEPEAHHGADCGPFPATHAIAADGAKVYQCRDHIMTTAGGDGYGVTYLTPSTLVDFSGGEAVIRFDISTFRSSERDWVDVWITPFEDQLVLPLNPGFPDLQGPPRRAVHVLLTAESAFCPAVWVDGAEVEDNQSPWRCRNEPYTSAPGFPGPSATRRDTIEVRISQTSLKMGMPAYNFWWYDETLRQPLDFSRGVVQFGHHSYSPEKGTRYASPTGPNTWHWDNVKISPSIPFTIIPVVNGFLSTPAPAGSYARFAAWGESVEISTDGGQTWAPAVKPRQDNDCCHIFSYLHPIPAGTTSLLLKGQPQAGGALPVRVTNLSVFALGAAAPPTPATATTTIPSATSAPTVTMTPTTGPTMAPTLTPTPPTPITPTATPTPSPAATATASPTAEPTAAPTAAPTVTPSPPTQTPVPQPPLCQVWGRIDGGKEQWFTIDCAWLLPTK